MVERPRFRPALSMLIAASSLIWLVSATPAGAASARFRGPGPLVRRNMNISTLVGNQDENAIAVNPVNPQNIVAESVLDHGSPDSIAGLMETYTFDGGQHWTTKLIANGDNLGTSCCDESLSFDSSGNLFMTYLFDNSGAVPVAESTDGGVSFHLIHVIQPTEPPASLRSAAGLPARLQVRAREEEAGGDQPTITTGAGEVWVTYTSFSNTSSAYVIQAAGAAIGDRGGVSGWVGPQNVPTKAGRGDYGDVAIGSRGQVMVTYQNPTGGQGPADLYVSLDADGVGPGGFSTPRNIDQTNVGGFDYIPAQSERSIDAEANLAWDRGRNHRVYIVWTSETPNESNDTDIMLQWSDNAGQTWSPPVRVNNDSTTNSQFMPSIAVNQTTGAVALSWYDSRNDRGNGKLGDTDGVPNDDAALYGTYTLDGGATFAPNFRISKGTSNATDAGSGLDYGDYTHAAFVQGGSNGFFYPVWSDNSNSTGDNPDGKLHAFDLYTSQVVIP